MNINSLSPAKVVIDLNLRPSSGGAARWLEFSRARRNQPVNALFVFQPVKQAFPQPAIAGASIKHGA